MSDALIFKKHDKMDYNYIIDFLKRGKEQYYTLLPTEEYSKVDKELNESLEKISSLENENKELKEELLLLKTFTGKNNGDVLNVIDGIKKEKETAQNSIKDLRKLNDLLMDRLRNLQHSFIDLKNSINSDE